jgi:hypothetical protein
MPKENLSSKITLRQAKRKDTDAARPIEYQTKTGATFVNSAQGIFLQIHTSGNYD